MNIFELFGTISIDNARANRAIDETTGHARSASNVFSKIGSVAVKAGKIAAIGIGAMATAVGKLTKDAVAAYADYEQLVGGVETLFKDSSDTVLDYANNAYKTAGMSANQYMDTVTAFSASLLQSLGGDTAKAAEYADLAITDMADNANKMGTSIGDIENAYKGFSKFNFAMLDNLRIGYGGTKSEMQRLLKDAEKIQKAHGKTVKYSINSYADMVEAIHVVQEEMGITGTTAEEAGTTIQGSVGMMKAAWTNFLTGMADSNQDFKALTTNLVQSVITVANNLVPRLIETVPRLVAGIAEIGTQLATYLPDIVASLLPALISGAVTLVSGLVKEIPALLSAIGAAISTAWTDSVWPMIQGLFKTVFGVDLPDWNTLIASISSGWNDTVWPAIQNFFKSTFGVDLPDWEGTKKAISDWWNNIWSGIKNLFHAVFSIFTEDSDGTTVAERINNWWEDVVTALGDIFCAIFAVNPEDESNPITRIKNWWDTVLKSFVNFFVETFTIWTDDSTSIAEKIKGWWESVKNFVGDIFKAYVRLVLPLVENVRKAITDWWAGVTSGVDLNVNARYNGGSQVGNMTRQMADQATQEPKSGAQQAGERWISNVKKTLGIHAAGAVFNTPTLFDTRSSYHLVGEAGPEAVAPIDVLQGYVKAAVAEANGNKDSEVAALKEVVQDLVSALPDMMVSAFATMRFDVNNREFARLVKAVN